MQKMHLINVMFPANLLFAKLLIFFIEQHFHLHTYSTSYFISHLSANFLLFYASSKYCLRTIFEKIVDIFDKQQIFGSFYTSMPTILHDYPQLIQVIRKYPMYWKKLQAKASYMLMKQLIADIFQPEKFACRQKSSFSMSAQPTGCLVSQYFGHLATCNFSASEKN